MGTPINRWDAIPPEIIRGLTLCANGSSWKDAAAAIGVRTATLRRWWRDERAERFIEEIVRENIQVIVRLEVSNRTYGHFVKRIAVRAARITEVLQPGSNAGRRVNGVEVAQEDLVHFLILVFT